MLASFRIGIDPTPDLGPVELAWHGIFTAVGLAVGLLIATRVARARGLDTQVTANLVLLAAGAGIVGSRLLYLIEHGLIDDPAEWIGTSGFSFYGALIAAPLAILVYLRRRRLQLAHLDALAWAFPLASAVGRLGDLINGEHYGPPTTMPWGIRYTHPDALTPDPSVAYHPGGLYEVLLGLVVAGAMWAFRGQLRRPLDALWAVIALYSGGRLLMFTWRSDSPEAFLGLDSGQWISIGLITFCLAAIAWRRRGARSRSG